MPLGGAELILVVFIPSPGYYASRLERSKTDWDSYY